MATGTQTEIEMFIERNCECNVSELIEWIIDLLPQKSFDHYIENIKLMNGELSEDEDARQIDDARRNREYKSDNK